MDGRVAVSAAGADADEAKGGSFVVRWRRRPEGERIEIEDVQSGERIRVSSVDRAVKWMRRKMGEPADEAGGAGPDAAGD